jgi:biopolymer transport protein TolR
MAEINVTPMVDVALVLLIVFMVAAPLLTAGVPLQLPETEAAPLPQEDRQPFTVQIGADGTVYVEETAVPAGGLARRLAAVAQERKEDRVYLRADRTLDYGRVMEVMAALQTGGFRSIALVTEPAAPGAEEEAAE